MAHVFASDKIRNAHPHHSERSRRSTMAKKENVWVIPHKDGWAVKRENSDAPTMVEPRKVDAESYARELARKDQVELIVQRADGTIQKRNSYGHDPFPPRDAPH